MRRNYLVLIGLILLGVLPSWGQSFYSIRRERHLIATGGIGTANYFGELTNPRSLGAVKYGLNVGLERYFGTRVSGRVEANWFRISGSDVTADDDRVLRNLNFVSNNIELASMVTVSLFPYGKRFYQRPIINFYGFIGVGVAYINPKTEHNGAMVALQPLQTEGIKYSRFQPVIPMGGGIKLKAGPFFNIIFEGGVRKTFTDYLDDISIKRYPDPLTLSSDLARELSNRSGGAARVRGNPTEDDWYFLMNAKVQFYLPYDIGTGSTRKLYNRKRKSYNSLRRKRR